jgi:hypothetical protein
MQSVADKPFMMSAILLNAIMVSIIMLNAVVPFCWGLLFWLSFMLSAAMEQRALKIVNNCLNTNIHSYLETSGG